MHYQEVVRRYLSVLSAISREWALSETLVLCVELDLSQSAAHGLLASSSSQRQRGPQFLRVTMFRVRPGLAPFLLTGAGDEAPLTRVEEENFKTANQWIEHWTAGSRSALPDSTSTVVADRLRRPGGV
jgi:hypothetical protein